VEFQADVFGGIDVNGGRIGAGVQHHVEWALSVDLYLKNDLVAVKVKRDFNKLLFPARLCGRNKKRYQEATQ
jgi:hypothetical protein